MYYVGFSYKEAYMLPLWERKWFIERLQTEIKRANGDSKATQAEARALQGKHRPQVPAKLRRFT